MNGQTRKDLVLLVADQNMKAAVEGLFERRESLRIRPVAFDIFVHVYRDPGCLKGSSAFLRPLVHRYRHALVMFDLEGSGRLDTEASAIELEVQAALQRTGWEQRATAIVLDPELEVWVWSDSPRVDEVLGWEERDPPLRFWLERQGLWERGRHKPSRPKEAMECALHEIRRPRTSVHFKELARRVGLNRCRDRAFRRFRRLMQEWFPAHEPQ